jgi:two-component system, sensor histidine kinase and response regulator
MIAPILAMQREEAMSRELLRILLIEDNHGDARLVREALAEAAPGQFELEHVDRLAPGLRRLGGGGLDLVLLDLSLPDSRGLDTFRAVHARAPGLPTIVLSGMDDEAVAVEALGKGAQDYLVKGQVTGTVLVRALRYALERKRIEEELRRAKGAAEVANRARGQFLANMSHEVRTPMNAILGMTELALGTDLPADLRDYLRVIKSSITSLLEVIDDILDFSRIEAGKLELNPIDFRLRECLGEVMSMFALRAHSKGLELAYRIRPDIPEWLTGDPVRLRQILINLVGNALKFTDRGEVVVEVEAEPRAGGEILLQVAVADTGIGIPRQELGAIFLPFVQADGSTTRQYGGTGLGLGITAKLVEMMGGRIWAESEVGRGSTFRFTARLAPARGAPAGPSAHELAAVRDLRVLVVDDSATQRRILEELLAHWHLRPTTVDSGRAALAALEHARNAGTPFHLVLLDAQMPDLDGPALAEQIRRDPGTITDLILLGTSVELRSDPGRARAPGIVASLMKPIKEADLLEAILKAVGEPAGTGHRLGPIGWPARRTDWRPLRLLLVEDNLFNQKVTSLMLEQQGHTVVLASTGAEAIEAVERGPFDLVLMDIQMPEMDGFQATAAIRARERWTGRHLPIVAMTAHALREDRGRCLDSGMDAYIAKPVQADVLIRAVEEAVFGPDRGEAPGSGGPSQGPLMDPAAALDRVGGDRDLLGQMAEQFLEECPRLMATLGEGLARHDAPRATAAAHDLKNWVGNFAAPPVFEALAALEELVRAGAPAGAEVAYSALEHDLGRLAEELARLVPEPITCGAPGGPAAFGP